MNSNSWKYTQLKKKGRYCPTLLMYLKLTKRWLDDPFPSAYLTNNQHAKEILMKVLPTANLQRQ